MHNITAAATRIMGRNLGVLIVDRTIHPCLCRRQNFVARAPRPRNFLETCEHLNFETWLFSVSAWQVLALIFCGAVALFLIFGARADDGRPTQARFGLSGSTTRSHRTLDRYTQFARAGNWAAGPLFACATTAATTACCG